MEVVEEDLLHAQDPRQLQELHQSLRQHRPEQRRHADAVVVLVLVSLSSDTCQHQPKHVTGSKERYLLARAQHANFRG